MERQRVSAEEENVKSMAGNGGYDHFDVKDAVMKRVRVIHAEQQPEGNEAAQTSRSVSPSADREQAQADGHSVPIMRRTQAVRQRKSRSKSKLITSGIAAAILVSAAGFGLFQLAADQASPEQPRTVVEIIESKEGIPLALNTSDGKRVLTAAHSKQGNVPLPSPSPAAVKYSGQLDTYKQQVEAGLAPGEKAVFYIKDAEFDKLANGLGHSSKLFDAVRPETYTDYASFENAWRGFGTSLPSSLPDGYDFVQGQIMDQTPLQYMSTEYRTILEQLEGEAQADTSRKKVFVRKLEQNPAKYIRVKLDFSRNGQQRSLQLSVTELTNGGSSTVNILPGQSGEKWSIGGKEALFISASSSGWKEGIWYAVNRLVYFDEAANATYTLSDVDNELTKSEWLALVPAFLK